MLYTWELRRHGAHEMLFHENHDDSSLKKSFLFVRLDEGNWCSASMALWIRLSFRRIFCFALLEIN